MCDDDRDDLQRIRFDIAAAMRQLGAACGTTLAASFVQIANQLKGLEESEQERKRRQRYESRRNRAPHPKVLR